MRTGENAFSLDVRADVAADLARRLMLYRLRAKADISVRDQGDVRVHWEGDSGGSQRESSASTADDFIDTRFHDVAVIRSYGRGFENEAARERWTRLRIEHAVAESGSDYQLGDAFPHDVLLDQNGGVGLRKGCYVGQEVVSRMQHRGTARRRVLIATGSSALPQPGTSLSVESREIGVLGSVSHERALAIVRIDRAREATDAGNPILAGDVPVSLTIPVWASFRFPEASQAEGS
jgi:tRNA-modifying protein YgfZ